MANKGTPYEREVCRQLSAWWSCDRHDDLFWRIPGSGGRATRRGRGGKRTSGQCGDIEATHPKAKALLRLFTIEVKRGYSSDTPFDLMDMHRTFACQEYESWVVQTQEAADYAKAPHWLIISRRDKRQAVVSFPQSFLTRLAGKDLPSFHSLLAISPRMQMTCSVRMNKQVTRSFTVVVMRLDDFFKALSPADVRSLLEKRNA